MHALSLLTELHEGQHWSGTSHQTARSETTKLDVFGKPGYAAMTRAAHTVRGGEGRRTTKLVRATITIGPITVDQDMSDSGEAADLCPRSCLEGDWPAPITFLKALKNQEQTKWRTLAVRNRHAACIAVPTTT